MRDDVSDAVLDCVTYATNKGTRSGRHIAPLALKIADDMARVGYDPNNIFLDDVNVTLPGWFRPSKKWDITAFEDSVLVAAIELKSINSSFGNNANNRAEEALGEGVAARYRHALAQTMCQETLLFAYSFVRSSTETSP